MDAWIGLAGVIAGAMIALSGQYLMRRTDARERSEALLLEQAAMVVALSKDYRNRVWEERNNIAANVVGAWDIGAFRLAEARLHILSNDPETLRTLNGLRRSGAALGRAWRLSPHDEQTVDAAWNTHHDAIEHFIAASSRSPIRGPNGPPRRRISSLHQLTTGTRSQDPERPPAGPNAKRAAAEEPRPT
jgi:hypothetical protein